MNVVADIRAAPKLESDELWFKDAIIYQLHVKAFADSNNDGIGDFAGLTEKLDYLKDLGVTGLAESFAQLSPVDGGELARPGGQGGIANDPRRVARRDLFHRGC